MSMLRHTHRSAVHVNRLLDYSLTDARLDNPHVPARCLPALVRIETHQVPPSRRRPPLALSVRRRPN